MTAIAEDSRRMHERVRDAVQAQLDGLAGQFSVSTNAMAATLHKQWQQVGEQTLARQLATCETLERTASKVTEHASHQAERTIAEIARLLNRSEELVRSRTEAEASLTQQHGERMDQLSTLWRTELAKLRQDEAGRGQAAVDRLDELQAAVASHLATLGAALETPLNRLLHTASEVPRAAAEVIAQLRLEMSHLTERDNLALQERVVLGEKVSTLLQTVHQSADAQRAAIESLVASAAEVLDKASRQFSQELGAQSTRTQEVAAQVTGSAIELSSLGEAFNHGVQLFTASNEKLMESLQRIEGAAQQSLARSDEQLAYYVAQAREVIDLSISSQQGIIEDLRRLHTGQQAMAQEVAG